MRKYVSAVRISIHHGIRMPALRLALDGYLMPHYRFLLGEMLDELSHIEGQLARLEGEFESQMRLFRKPCMPVRKRRPTADMMDLWMGEVGWSGKSPMTHFAIISRATPPASIKNSGQCRPMVSRRPSDACQPMLVEAPSGCATKHCLLASNRPDLLVFPSFTP